MGYVYTHTSPLVITNFKKPWLAFPLRIIQYWDFDFMTVSLTASQVKPDYVCGKHFYSLLFLVECANYLTFQNWFPELLPLFLHPLPLPALSKVGLAPEVIHLTFYFPVHQVILFMLEWDLHFLNAGCTSVSKDHNDSNFWSNWGKSV